MVSCQSSKTDALTCVFVITLTPNGLRITRPQSEPRIPQSGNRVDLVDLHHVKVRYRGDPRPVMALALVLKLFPG